MSLVTLLLKKKLAHKGSYVLMQNWKSLAVVVVRVSRVEVDLPAIAAPRAVASRTVLDLADVRALVLRSDLSKEKKY